MKKQRGQVALIVMLVMAVGLTVGLSAAQRATTSVSVSQTEKQGSKAYSAAEAGIEKALKVGLENDPDGTITVGGIDVNYSTDPVNLIDLGEITLNQDNILQFAEGGTFSISGCNVGTRKIELISITSAGAVNRDVVDCDAVGSMRSIPTSGLFRVRPIGGDVSFSLSGSGIGQYFKVTSQAQADSGETRAVEVIRSGPYLPAIFNYVLFSGGGVSFPEEE